MTFDIRMHYAGPAVDRWNDISTAVSSVADLIDFNTEQGTGISFDSRTNAFNFAPIGAGGSPATGDAEWVNSGSVTGNAGTRNSGFTEDVFSGFPLGEDVIVQFYGINSSGSNVTRVIVQGEEQFLPTAGNLTECLTFVVQPNSSGEIIVNWSTNISDAFANALRFLKAEPAPSITLDSTPVYGEAISGTYANFGGTPTGPLQADDGTRQADISISVDSNNETFTGTFPALPAAGQSLPAGSLPFPGSIDVTLPDPGE